MKTLVEYFGASYLINLPERVDRLKVAKKELARVGWNIGDNGVQIVPALSFSERAGFPNAAVRGCFQSHLECLRRAQVENRRSVLILEDDIGLSSSLGHLTPSIISQLDIAGWDFAYFGHYGTGEIPNARSNMVPSELKFDVWTAPISCTHFYGINSRIFARLIADLERHASGVEGDQEAGPMPVDGAFNMFRRDNPNVRTLIAHPKLGWQRSSRSDINPQKLDRVHFLRPLTAIWRDIKYTAKRWRT
jgi:glycosyl transferase, family 25